MVDQARPKHKQDTIHNRQTSQPLQSINEGIGLDQANERQGAPNYTQSMPSVSMSLRSPPDSAIPDDTVIPPHTVIPSWGWGHCLFESRYPKQNYIPPVLCYYSPLSL